VDGDRVLNKLEFKSCLSALGIIAISFEGSDAKFDAIFKKVSGGKDQVSFDAFVDYMVTRAQDTMDASQIKESFATLAGGKGHLSLNDCKVGLTSEEIEFITLAMPQVPGHEGQYDYNAYVAASYK